MGVGLGSRMRELGGPWALTQALIAARCCWRLTGSDNEPEMRQLPREPGADLSGVCRRAAKDLTS